MVQLYNIIIQVVIPVVTTIIGLILEHYMSLISQLKKIKSILFNDSAKLDLLVWFESKEDFIKLKKELIDIAQKDLDKVITNSESELYLKLSSFNIKLLEHNPHIYIFGTENISTGIRNLKKEVQFAIYLLSSLRERFNDITFKDISVDLYLPYKSDYVPNIKIKNYRLKDYKIIYVEEKFKSHIELTLEKINITYINLENLIYAIDNFISLL